MKITTQSGSLIQAFPFAEMIEIPGSINDAPVLGVTMRGGEVFISFLLQQPNAQVSHRHFVIFADEEVIPNAPFKYHHYVGSVLSKGLHVFELI